MTRIHKELVGKNNNVQMISKAFAEEEIARPGVFFNYADIFLKKKDKYADII